jgi:Fe-S-cluster containining protein
MCCEELGGMTATEEDIQRFEEEAPEVMDTISVFHYGDYRSADLWMDMATGEECSGCPWFLGNCLIYEARPAVCRNYPETLDHAKASGCRGLNNGQPIQEVSDGHA